MNQTFSLYLFIATGGAIGACLRFFMTGLMNSWFGKGFPFGTLAVNVIGSFFLATLYGLIERGDIADQPFRALIGVGMLGALTTFSTFTVETLTLLDNGLWVKAAANILLNVCACLLAAWLAMELTKG